MLGAVTSRAADSEAQLRMHQVENQFVPAVPADGTPMHPTTLQKRMTQLHVPGVSIAVVHNGKIDWAKGYGLVREGGSAVTTDTLFQAASISKPVTALAVLHLAEAGRINLTHQANEYLKSWKIPETPLTAKSKVTIAELLNHTAGINIEGFSGYTPGQPIPTLQQMLRGEPPAFGPALAVTSAPGSEFRYAGGGYVILRALLTDVTGQPFERLMHETVLQPLGMTHSTFQQPLPTELAAMAAMPHDAYGQVFERGARIYPEEAPDGLWTTASDIARYILAMQQSVKAGGFLSKEMANRMFAAGKNHWGPGPILGQDPKHPYFMFSGGNYGFISVFVAYESGDGVAVLTNGDGGIELGSEVVRTVAQVYGWPDFQPVHHQSVTLPPGSLDDLAGVYRESSGSMVAITRKKDDLFLVQVGGQNGPVRLYAQSKDKFIFDTGAGQNFPEIAEALVTFGRAADGRSQTMEQVVGGRGVLPAAIRLAPANERPILEQLKQTELRVEKKTAVPGGADALRRLMANIDAGTPEKSPLGPDAASVLRRDRTANVKVFGSMGPIISISYKGTTPGGWDTYRVLFRRGDCVFHILVDDRGEIQSLDVRVN
jgi:CubicO group peptidase (beta-lactamase class C family)